MIKDVVILGSSGFAKDVLEILEDNNEAAKQWNILGFIDFEVSSEPVEGYRVIGDDEWLLSYPHPVNAVCGFGAPALRRKVLEKYKGKNHISFPALISHVARVSRHVRLGEGCVICPGVCIAPNVRLGDFVSLNLNCTIGHDTQLRDFIMVNPGANIAGNVLIDSDCEIGTGSCVIQGKRIGPQTIIGAGSVIIRDIPGQCTVVGNPGRILEKK